MIFMLYIENILKIRRFKYLLTLIKISYLFYY